MKKAKLTLAILVVLAVVVFVLAACDKNSDTNVIDETRVKLAGFKQINDETIGTMYYISIPNTKMVYSLSDVVTVSNNSTWTVSTDISGNKTIASKTLQLDEGDNLYYLQVRDDKSNVKQYVLLIHRKFMYTVTYKSNGSTLSTEKVEEGKYANPPTVNPPTGYTFNGWEYDFTKPVDKNLTINAKLKQKEYTISFNPNGGSLTNTTQTVLYNTYVSLPTPTRAGYTFDGWYSNSKKYSSDYYTYDFNLNLKAEWTAKKYTITYNLGGGTNSPDNDTYYYAYEPIVLCSPTLEGYEFLGWTYDGMTTPQKNLVIEGSYGNRTFTANWNKIKDPNDLEESSGLEYTLDGDTLTVTGIGTCTDENIVLPYVYEGKRVTKIGDDAFRGCTTITSVIIPDSVTSIGEYAFYYCPGLTSVTIGNGVTKIGDYAFCNCTSLKNIVIPDNVNKIGDAAFHMCDALTNVTIGKGVTSIGEFVFYFCPNLKDITVDVSNESYTSISGNLYTKDEKTLVLYTAGKTTKSFTTPNNVTTIDKYAFACSSHLTSVILSNNVVNIRDDAFSFCKNLKSITLPEGLTSIGENAFYDCYNLTQIIIPNSVTKIGDYAFLYCDKLTIYCKATSKPSGWSSAWNPDDRIVIWGY